MRVIQKRKTLQSQVYEYLKEEIIIGNIEPGERLIEEKVSEKLQVSRSPIREAVRMLEKDGLLFVNKSGGVTVFKPSIDDFRNLYECRVEMESLASYYAAQRRSSEDVEIIRLHLLQAGKLRKEDNMKKIHDVNESFHDSVVRASENPFLIKMTSQLRGVNSFYRKAILEIEPMHMKDAQLEHQNIFQAIVDQDKDEARRLMKVHIENDYKLFIKLSKNK